MTSPRCLLLAASLAAASVGTSIAAAPAEPPPIAQRTWPDRIDVPGSAIEVRVVSETPGERKFVYRSEAFEFTSQAQLAASVMKEIARTFECTRLLLDALPWGVVCRPPEGFDCFRAALFETRADYQEAGGPQNSGGVYMRDKKIFLVPFNSLGLEQRGKRYYKNDNYRSDTLVHEITHQLMHDLLTFLPTWVVEGTAEYTNNLPFNAGKFIASHHERGLKQHIDLCRQRQVSPDIDSIERLVKMKKTEWSNLSVGAAVQHELYLHSTLLVYYFCHLDGDGKGTRFMTFMEAARKDLRAYEDFFKQPGVERLPDGRFRYPTSLTPPDTDYDTAPFKHLDLLIDGRSFETLAQDVEKGFKSIGIRIQVK